MLLFGDLFSVLLRTGAFIFLTTMYIWSAFRVKGGSMDALQYISIKHVLYKYTSFQVEALYVWEMSILCTYQQ